MIFPKCHTHAVKEKKEVMIMFLESNPKFQDISYVHIWFRIAEECFSTKTRIKVPYIPFAPASNGRIPSNNKMSFFESLNSNSIQNSNNNESENENKTPEIDYDEDNDEEIITLTNQFKKLGIFLSFQLLIPTFSFSPFFLIEVF